MGFTVEAYQLGLFAGVVSDSARDASAAQRFADQNVQIGRQPGLLAQFVGSHEQAKAEQADRGSEALQQLAAVRTPEPKLATQQKREPVDDEYEDFSDRSWIDG